MKDIVYSNEELRDAGLYLGELICASLNGKKAKEKPEDVSWELIWELVQKSCIEGLSIYGVDTLKNLPPMEIYMQWKKRTQYVIFRNCRMDEERRKILTFMKKEGISYFLLKGIHLQEYYPQPGMRAMGDNDILYGFVESCPEGGYQIQGPEAEQTMDEASKIVSRIMKERGYRLVSDVDVHKVFFKEPFCTFEMHRRLVNKDNMLSSYYHNPWKYAVPSKQDENEYYFRKEDEFIYTITHGYKHFSFAGCGIRLFADVYVLLLKNEDSMDAAYISNEFEKLGLSEFAKLVVSAAKKVFDPERTALEKDEEELFCLLLTSGVFGNYETLLENRYKKYSEKKNEEGKHRKFGYLWTRLFPEKDWWEMYYPICRGKAWMIPLCWVYRISVRLWKKRKKIWKELKYLIKNIRS